MIKVKVMCSMMKDYKWVVLPGVQGSLVVNRDGYKLVIRVLRSGATSDKLARDESFSSDPVGVSQGAWAWYCAR